MNKHSLLKSIQLILLLLITAAVLVYVFGNSFLYHSVANDPATRLLCTALWAVLGISFVFLGLDFFFFMSYRKDYREMNYALHSDPVSGIANRFSCDALVEKYLDRPLPENIGCIMIDISNIREINSQFGHLQGNVVISDFAGILNIASVSLCFVGRNGGNKFLAVFEEATQEKMDLFLTRVRRRVDEYNKGDHLGTIEYRYGTAFHENEEINEITKLIATSNSRIYSDN